MYMYMFQKQEKIRINITFSNYAPIVDHGRSDAICQ